MRCKERYNLDRMDEKSKSNVKRQFVYKGNELNKQYVFTSNKRNHEKNMKSALRESALTNHVAELRKSIYSSPATLKSSGIR